MAKQPAKEEKATKLSRTISNGTGTTHTHITRGGGRMQKHVLVPVYCTDTLDESVKAQICDMFINQLVKVALGSLNDKNTDIPSN